MITFLKIFLGWKGTWFWACRRMNEGQVVYRLRDSGMVEFTYDQGVRKIKAMILWETSIKPHEWGISMEDVFATDFKILYELPNDIKMQLNSQLKTTNCKPARRGD